ncbi:MAG: hypothetical protein SGILL_005435 [Bacillariaceae sp.]
MASQSITTLDLEKFQTELARKDPYDIATILLELLVERQREEVDGSVGARIRRSKPTHELQRKRQARMIEVLMEELQQYGRLSPTGRTKGLFGRNSRPNRPPHMYDASESLLSGFFCTLYWYTPGVIDSEGSPKPIWEQVSLKDGNIKGQQYYKRNDFQEAVINYSEIWGRSVFLTAEGTFAPIEGIEEQPGEGGKTQPPVFNALKRTVPKSRTLRACPDVFRVDATKVSLHLLGLKVDLPIKGSSNLVILYADPRIRIFISPTESKTAVGNWEEAGLVVAQVRSDFVLGDAVMDLR